MKIVVTLVNENLAHARGGEVVLYKRGDSKRWQARFKLKDLKWHRVATKQVNIQYAAEAACEAYDRARSLEARRRTLFYFFNDCLSTKKICLFG
jgi:hypothetical protein